MKLLAVFVMFLVTAVIMGLVLSYPLMLLWNGCLVSAIDGINEVTWLQMFGIVILTNLLFKSHASVNTERQ